MDLSTVLSILAVIAAIGFPLLSRRDLLTKLETRDAGREEWRQQVISDLEILKRSATTTELALLRQSVDSLVKNVEQLWKYTSDVKHLQVDPYIRATDVLKQRVDNMERR